MKDSPHTYHWLPLIEKDTLWKHKKTHKIVRVLNQPESQYSHIVLLHANGRKTRKQQHYFIYDYEKINE